MDRYRGGHWSRREFLGGLALAGTAGLIGLNPKAASADPPPETTTIRLIYDPDNSGLCYAPVFVTSQLLRGEGFTEVRYVRMIKETAVETPTLAAGLADMSAAYVVDFITAIDKGMPVVVLAGIHGGCQELVASDRIRTIRDLKGKKIAVPGLGLGDHIVLSNMLAYIGLDPRKDVQWVPDPPAEMIKLLAEGKVDAVWAFPPMPQQLRTRKIGHTLINTATDPPWSQLICCMIGARREFVQKYPVATKRALRAILKANQLCTSEPERSAHFLVDKSFNLGASYQETVQTLKDVHFASVWRDYDPEAAFLFHTLRMRESGYTKTTPQKIIAQGTDWRFLNQLKKELKA